MTVFTNIPTINIVAGDEHRQPVAFVANDTPYDLSAYTSFKSQWRVTADKTASIDIVVESTDLVGGELTLVIAPDKTRKMLGDGVMDIEAFPGPVTIARFNTLTEQDVTR